MHTFVLRLFKRQGQGQGQGQNSIVSRHGRECVEIRPVS